MSPNSEEPASVSSPAGAQTDSVPIPNDALIIVPVRNTVLFPGVVAPITISRPKAIAAAQQALREQRPIGGHEWRTSRNPRSAIARWA